MTAANQEFKRLRKQLGMTQKQLAEKIGISSARYSSWERGEKQPSTAHIQALASQLQCPVSKLIKPDQDQEQFDCLDDKAPNFSYFVSERNDEHGKSSFHEQLIIKLTIFENPMIFSLSDDCSSKVFQAISQNEHDFIWVETFNEEMRYINTTCIEWAIRHNDAADEFPELSGGKFHETSLSKADVTKNFLLWMMARCGDIENETSNYFLAMDFEWLTQTRSRLIDDIPQIIQLTRDKFGENYSTMINDKKEVGYDSTFSDVWGVRIYLKSGEQIFLPGMSCRGDGWNEVLIDIQNMTLYDENPIALFSDFDSLNRYMIPVKSIAMVEYPNVFDGMGLHAQFEDKNERSQDETETIIKSLYDMAWHGCNEH